MKFQARGAGGGAANSVGQQMHQAVSEAGDLALPDPPSRMIVRQGSMSVVVDNTTSFETTVADAVERLGGFTLDSSQNPDNQLMHQRRRWLQARDSVRRFRREARERAGRSPLPADFDDGLTPAWEGAPDPMRLTFTLKVPVERFDVLRTFLRGAAVEVSTESVTASDVSEEYHDANTGKAILEQSLKQFELLLSKATDTKEALQVMQQMDRVKERLDRLKGRMKFLERRAAMSTIHLQANLPGPGPEPRYEPDPTDKPPKSWWPWKWRPWATIGSAVSALLGMVAVAMDGAIWMVVFVGPIAAALFFLGKATGLIRVAAPASA